MDPILDTIALGRMNELKELYDKSGTLFREVRNYKCSSDFTLVQYNSYDAILQSPDPLAMLRAVLQCDQKFNVTEFVMNSAIMMNPLFKYKGNVDLFVELHKRGAVMQCQDPPFCILGWAMAQQNQKIIEWAWTVVSETDATHETLYALDRPDLLRPTDYKNCSVVVGAVHFEYMNREERFAFIDRLSSEDWALCKNIVLDVICNIDDVSSLRRAKNKFGVCESMELFLSNPRF